MKRIHSRKRVITPSTSIESCFSASFFESRSSHVSKVLGGGCDAREVLVRVEATLFGFAAVLDRDLNHADDKQNGKRHDPICVNKYIMENRSNPDGRGINNL
eukprot:scaffold5863_cov90-Skeletonema_dohrnii-CCMP3373.AAC.9